MAHICDCPKPPGGQARCEPHQLAICRVSHGVARTRCVDPPQKSQSKHELQNWALMEITGTKRKATQPITRQDIAILESGRYEDVSRQLVVTFSLPLDTSRGVATV